MFPHLCQTIDPARHLLLLVPAITTETQLCFYKSQIPSFFGKRIIHTFFLYGFLKLYTFLNRFYIFIIFAVNVLTTELL